MTKLKTQKNAADVSEFVDAIEPGWKREDCRTLLTLMGEVTGAEPVMWGSAIVGFGSYHYKYASGREGDWFVAGFAPRKQALTVYVMDGFSRRQELMDKLGKHKTGKSCLYIKKLADVDMDVLRELLDESVRYMKETYPDS